MESRWLRSINAMLFIFERETKFTLQDVNEDFKCIGLSFDPDFRFQFLDIISKRVGRIYDEFIQNLRFREHHQSLHSNAGAVGLPGPKRKRPDDDNVSDSGSNKENDHIDTNGGPKSSEGRREPSAAKRPRTGQLSDGQSATEASRENGPQAIDPEKAFEQGYVVVIPLKPQHETPNTNARPSVDGVSKIEPLSEADGEEPAEPSASPPNDVLPSTSTPKKDIGRKPPVRIGSSPVGPTKMPSPKKATRKSQRISIVKSEPSEPGDPAETNEVNAVKYVPKKSERPKPLSKKVGRSIKQKLDPTFKCVKCEYKTAWTCNFKRHLLIHHNPGIDRDQLHCELCARTEQSSAGSLPKRR